MTDEDIGYKKPPVKGRFKKGSSGNPKGRPKRKPKLHMDVLQRFLNGRVEYRGGGVLREATREELSIRTHLNHAVNGSVASAEFLLKLREYAQRHPAAGTTQIEVTGWLPDYLGQTGEQKLRDTAVQDATQTPPVISTDPESG
jgi:hypothetical protein